MSFEIIFLFVLLFVTVVLLVSDKLRLDIVALMVIASLMLSGILTPGEALAGFGDPVVFLIAALFVIGEALYRTGLAAQTGEWMMRVAGHGETRLIVLLMLVVAILSAFMSSTGAIAIFIPIAMTLASKTGVDVKKLLMPMAIASLIGGMLTLIGTPPNIIVSTQLERIGLEPFSFFSFTPAGAVILLVGIVYMITVGKKFIAPSKKPAINTNEKSIADLKESYKLKGQLYKISVEANSDLVGLSLADTQLRRIHGFVVIALMQQRVLGSKIIAAYSGTQINTGDTLYLVRETIDDNEGQHRYHISQVAEDDSDREKIVQVVGAAEVMVAPDSGLIGKSIKSFKFRDKFQLSVVRVFSNKHEHHHYPLDLELAAGDRLLVAGSWKNIDRLTEINKDLILLTLPQEHKSAVPKASKAPIAVGILLIMLVSLTFKLLPTEITVLLTALLFGATGCINMEQAYKSISWQSLVLIAGMLPMATAMQKTGAMTLIVHQLVELLGDAGPLVIMATLFVITAVFSQFISNTATAVLIAPIATGLAETMSVSAYPLVMIVAIAASTSFSTPVASPVNALILGPGGYKFGDFAKVGIPLQVIILAISLIILPVLFPF